MPSFGKSSKKELDTCHEALQVLFNKVVKEFDCSVLKGYRGEKEQNEAFDRGNSTLKYPNGKHNQNPSIAVDVIPYPEDWEDRERMSFFAGFVKGVSLNMGLKIRWGGDWNSDTQVKDNNFDDLVHFELVL